MGRTINRQPTVTFLLPGATHEPGGGIRVVFEYSNYLAEKGCKVNVVSPAFLCWKKSSFIKKLKLTRHYFRIMLTGWKCSGWFALHKDVHQFYPFSLNFRNIPPSDIYVATEVRTSFYLKDYPVEDSRKFYFIQGYEDWASTPEELKETYRYPMTKITISKWLRRLIAKEGQDSVFIPNGFDFEVFHLDVPVENRNRFTVSIMYSEHSMKDVSTTIKALSEVKKKYKELKVVAFGTTPRPSILPEWYDYTQRPDRAALNSIYNSSSIFVASSLNEGWGLTVGEAMTCGNAIACTDIKGYKEMVTDAHTALLSAPGDYHGLAGNVIRLIEDDNLRIRLARNGSEDIRRFDKKMSAARFMETLGLIQDV